MPAVLDLINSAASKLGVKGSGKQLSGEDVQIFWDNLNCLVVDGFGAERQLSWSVKQFIYPLPGTGQYIFPIGPTAPSPWTQPRPTTIQSWGVIIPGGSPSLEITKRKVLTADEYNSLPQKALPGPYPTKLYYDYAGDITSGNGNVITWPANNTGGYSLVLYIPQTVGPFYSLTQQVFGSAALPTYGSSGVPCLTTYPPGYYKLLVYSLAAESAADFGRPIPPEVAAFIARTMSKIKSKNIYVPEQVTSFGAAGVYDAYTDEPNR